MRTYNFFVCGPKFTKFQPQRWRGCSWSYGFQISLCRSILELLALKVKSCQKSRRILDVFCPLKFCWGHLSEEFSPSRMPLLDFSLEPNDTIISSPVLWQLHWLHVQRRVGLQTSMFCLLIFVRSRTSVLCLQHTFGLRRSTDRSCAIPRTHNTFRDRSFAVAGLCVWNSLPAHLRDEDIT